MAHAWAQTANGKAVDLLDPTVDVIEISEIAGTLARINRWNGCYPELQDYSVAAHSILVTDLCSEEAKPYAILHDAHEAFIGDITSPQKIAINALARFDLVHLLAEPHDRVIHEAFGLQWPPHPIITVQVKAADMLALAIEKRDLLQHSEAWELSGAKLPEPPKDVGIPFLTVREAEQKFIQYFMKYVHDNPGL